MRRTGDVFELAQIRNEKFRHGIQIGGGERDAVFQRQDGVPGVYQREEDNRRKQGTDVEAFVIGVHKASVEQVGIV